MAQSTLRVLDFNILYDKLENGKPKDDPGMTWGVRRNPMISFIRSLDCDLIGMQEVLPDQFAWLREQAQLGSEYDSFGEQSLAPDDPNHAALMHKREFCPVWWRRERFALEDSGMLWLNARNVCGCPSRNWPAMLPRACSWVKLYDKQVERSLRFYCTHFDSVPVPWLYFAFKAVHMDSACWIMNLIAQHVLTDTVQTPCILVGDLNLTEDKSAHATLAKGLTDCFTALNPGAVRPFSSFDSRIAPTELSSGVAIDYVFSSGSIAPRNFAIHKDLPVTNPPRYFSDHYPLVAELDWK